MLTTRADLNVGYSCNIRCKFCYYQQTVRDDGACKDLDSEQIKGQLAYLRSMGIDTVDFTGGEPTIRPDLLELVEHARRIGFRSVCVITNGIRLSHERYVKRCVEAGVDDFLVSIHSHDPAIHDALTEVPGSLNKAIQAVELLRDHPVKVRVNCVINGLNHTGPVQAMELFHKLGLQTVNFIMFNPIVEADWNSAPELNVAYSEAAPHLQAAIDAYRDRVRKITIRYIPLCLMLGYERYVTNIAQIQYDPDEWDYLVRTTLREGRRLATAALWAGMLLHPSKRRALARGWGVFKREGIKYFLQLKNKRHGPACRRCAYRLICDGLWRNYVQWRGFDELKPMGGQLIKDPAHFMLMNPAFGLSGPQR